MTIPEPGVARDALIAERLGLKCGADGLYEDRSTRWLYICGHVSTDSGAAVRLLEWGYTSGIWTYRIERNFPVTALPACGVTVWTKDGGLGGGDGEGLAAAASEAILKATEAKP